MQSIPSISVIICAYTEKRLQDLLDTVRSVQQQTLSPEEIIVVIDHNPILMEKVQKKLPDIVTSALTTDIVLIKSSETPGLSGARNSGIAVAKGQIIAFLDDDAIATCNWLKFLCDSFADPQILGAGGAVLPVRPQQKVRWFPEKFLWVIGCTYRGMPLVNGIIRNPIRANMAFKREVFDEVREFYREVGRISTWPIGCEETELCIHANQHWPDGYFLYRPEARVNHRIPSQRLTWRYFCTRCYCEGLSKAFVVRYVGTQAGIASERKYTFNALPRGILRGFKDLFSKNDLSGVARSAAILVGLAMTASGYFIGLLQGHHTALHNVEQTLSSFHIQRNGTTP